jgi:hypothetical protein
LCQEFVLVKSLGCNHYCCRRNFLHVIYHAVKGEPNKYCRPLIRVPCNVRSFKKQCVLMVKVIFSFKVAMQDNRSYSWQFKALHDLGDNLPVDVVQSLCRYGGYKLTSNLEVIFKFIV